MIVCVLKDVKFMKKQTLSESNFELWLLFGKAHHSMELARQRELNQYHIPFRQTYVLRTVKDLGANATLAEVAKEVDRKVSVITKQAISMEKDGLIKRIKDTPKSNLIRLELTDKGQEITKVTGKSKSFDQIFSFLTVAEREQTKLMFQEMSGRAEKYISK